MAVTANKVWQVTVTSEDSLEGEWIRNLIVIAPDEGTAQWDAEQEVKSWGEAVQPGTETYELGTERARVVGLLAGEDER